MVELPSGLRTASVPKRVVFGTLGAVNTRLARPLPKIVLDMTLNLVTTLSQLSQRFLLRISGERLVCTSVHGSAPPRPFRQSERPITFKRSLSPPGPPGRLALSDSRLGLFPL